MSTEIVVAPVEHSEHGASISARWMNCHGSVRLARLVPAGGTNAAAERGTALHEVAALCLTNGQDAIEYVGRTVNGIEIDATGADETQIYLDHCRGRPAGTRFVEHRFNLSALHPAAPMFGTADHVVYVTEDGTLYVDDLKTGYAYVPPDAPQLKYYALGAMLSVHPLPVRRVVVAIVQPKNGGVKQIEIDAFELMEWSGELLAHVAATLEPAAPLTSGPWCSKTYCPAAGTCPAYARLALEIAQAEFSTDLADAGLVVAEYNPPSPDTMDSATLGRLWSQVPLFAGWLKTLEAEVSRRAHLADPALGWQIVATEARADSWNNDSSAWALAVEHGIPAAELTAPVEPLSPAKVRGVLAARAVTAAALDGAKLPKKAAEQKAREILAPFVRRSAGTALVPVTDSRPALAGAGSEFSEMPALADESI